MDYHSYNTISIIHNFFSKFLCHSLLQQKIDYSRIISTISTFIRDAYPHSYAAQRSAALWRVTASDLRRRSWSWPLQRLYDHMCQCVSVSMCTQIWGQYHLTIQVKIGCPTGWLKSLNLSPGAARVHHPLVLYAALLTMLLAHPLWVPYCLYSKSGLFWAKWLSGQNNIPTLLKLWRIIHYSSSTS